MEFIEQVSGKIWLSAGIVVVFGLALCGFVFRDPRRKHLPPIVRGYWPILNHTLFHMMDDPIDTLIQWRKEYGEIFRTKSGTSTFIWLSSERVTKALIDRRGNIYSSRQPMPMASDLVSGGMRVTFMPYGKEWRTVRSLFQRLLTPAMAKSYSPIQEYEARQVSVDLLDNPDDFYMHYRRYASSVIMQIAYGRRVPKWDCQEIKDIYGVMAHFANVRRPGAYLVDTCPALAKFPFFDLFSKWRSIGKSYFDSDLSIWLRYWNQAVKEVEAGSAKHSFGKDFIQSEYHQQGWEPWQAAYIMGSVLEGGSETTSALLNNIMVGILSNPEVLQKAQEELDLVVGPNRTPTWDDEENLPYIRAIVKEVHRWRPINKFGQNHATTQDDWYEGYFIPKGSIAMINWFAIHYDEERFPEPYKFKPERYLTYTKSAAYYAANSSDDVLRDHYDYGAGRRLCPGLHIAERSIYYNTARTLWGFNIQHAKDANGQIIPVDFTSKGLQPGSGSIAKPFSAKFTPRSAKHEEILRREWNEAQNKGVDFSQVDFRKIVDRL